MNIHAIDASETPRSFAENRVAAAAARFVALRVLPAISGNFQGGAARRSRTALRSFEFLELSVVFEGNRPVFNQLVQSFLRRALAGDDIVVDPLLHCQKEFRVDRLLPEVLHARHGL